MMQYQDLLPLIDSLKEAAKKKYLKVDLDKLVALDEQRKEVVTKLNALQAERNVSSSQNKKPSEEEMQKMRLVKESIQGLEAQLALIEKDLEDILWYVPQIPVEDTPIGPTEDDFRIDKEFGDIKLINARVANPKFFAELAENLDLIDYERGVKVHGFRGYYLKNELAILERAILHYVYLKLFKKGFTALQVPTLTREKYMYGTGYLPFASDNVFKIHQTEEDLDKPPMYLVGSSEVTLVAQYADEIVDVSKPIKLAGNSSCFRSEVGSYGKQAKGIYRVHEFQKIEQVILCENNYETSDILHQEIISNTIEIWKELGVPFRIIQNSSSDMGIGKYKMFDFEAYSINPEKQWCEVASASNLGDWQARRLNVKYIDLQTNEKRFVHTLNNTAIATPRCLIPLVEWYQNTDGSITIPEVLRPFTGFDKIG